MSDINKGLVNQSYSSALVELESFGPNEISSENLKKISDVCLTQLAKRERVEIQEHESNHRENFHDFEGGHY